MKSILISFLLVTSLWSKDMVKNSFILITTKTNGYNYVCSGVAVAPKKILTAAHCLDDARSVSVVKQKSTGYRNTYVMVLDYEQHPDYDRDYSFFLNDIGILYLNEEVLPEEEIISLREIDPTKNVFRIGFGARDGRNVMNLFELAPPIYRYDSYFYLYDYNSFSGDSGGPLFQKIENEYYLVGIHSTLEGRSKTFNVAVSFFDDWILDLEI